MATLIFLSCLDNGHSQQPPSGGADGVGSFGGARRSITPANAGSTLAEDSPVSTSWPLGNELQLRRLRVPSDRRFLRVILTGRLGSLRRRVRWDSARRSGLEEATCSSPALASAVDCISSISLNESNNLSMMTRSAEVPE
eukprot:CAMPEP_0169300810 /NCGR_PEP_ID=MMETSP1016-20121227/67889_1 /TAXON_ID=342587 /ORGANISM="Karlodinium micrum, Strain CCMP2283" /LENGTH=139 /DNA_ID=CAMNT_0009393327 /DNA_START=191 /DNA_END=610 /DNA_ORIENTATION=+